MASLFAGDLSEDDLHIWVKVPSMSSLHSNLNLSKIAKESDPSQAAQLLLLNCLILGDKSGATFNLESMSFTRGGALALLATVFGLAASPTLGELSMVSLG